ncbi:MAG: glutamine--fructose-6-phosphate transaminase (isomerizing) [Candidatus Wallbacteria bacterium HGW-Wallbacteria-1]|jgi:glucosamine--fructose-6-phosphate aminotransferase (isomerizing)|uniref:Glutamine--fructose-6-phosphate aminotransferase [isomerizing] n=1 Tax=Candidatus Wallbacteria bacterium HGW-Wallbacteria-1 TaxID=2013854 RepID=A0A2N1PSD2_9BACT|nr:MAG: glutamine--fructose-6-phosphate transaminase (isomerizing) [Candidatus Wallbacteria bacterium HGW-Wallbacteria-1]
MCGIVGFIGREDGVPVILDGLAKLEYRGYDSAGVAVLCDGSIRIEKRMGRLEELRKALRETPISGCAAIGHTRWATHGKPSQTNAHPHAGCMKDIVVVHNGIIENFTELKEELVAKGHKFSSDTDTEVLVHLVEEYHKGDLVHAVKMALSRVTGSYALAVLDSTLPDTIVAARRGSPLVIGVGIGATYLASDIPALLSRTRKMVFLEDGEVAILTPDDYQIISGGSVLNREPVIIQWDPVMAEKGGFEHFMLKEIHEQPKVVMDTLSGRVRRNSGEVTLDDLGISPEILRDTRHITVVACGTSYHAGLVFRHITEKLADIRVDVEHASEYRYRHPIVRKGDVVLVISQSGETADTLAAMRMAMELGIPVLGIVNAVGSTITREADGVLYTRAGPEIGVASTKAFTAQLVAVYILALYLGRNNGSLSSEDAKVISNALFDVPQAIETVIQKSDFIKSCAEKFNDHHSFLFLGRGLNYPVALEGALKLKEISYIHAEGYPAGEMKHGPIALVEPDCPTMAIALEDDLYDKMISNIQEVKAREGKVIGIGYADDHRFPRYVDFLMTIPRVPSIISPMVTTIPTQLFAYYCACFRGCDVDKPRNLAKSVTVE